MTGKTDGGVPVVAWRVSNETSDPVWALRKTEPRGWAMTQPLVLATDYAALLAERDALVADAERLVKDWRAEAVCFGASSYETAAYNECADTMQAAIDAARKP